MRFSKADAAEAKAVAAIPPTRKSVIASAVEVNVADFMTWRNFRLGRDEIWQKELWRLYDLVGEFRFASNWVGSMMSQVRLYIADVDENGNIGAETTDPEVLALGDMVLGGPTTKSELLRLMGVNFTVGGEFYIVGRAARADRPDQWYVVTPSELTRYQGGIFYASPDGPIELLDGVDLLVRVWTPHPNRVWLADSPARSAMQILVEIEKLTRYVFAQMDSRLVSGGLLFIPNDLDFPDDDGTQGGADSLMAKMVQAGTASLKGEGSAAGIFPLIAEVPPEALGKIQFVDTASELSKQAMDLRQEAILRFAYSMDFPPEVMTGLAGSSHWSAWYIDENAVKVHVEPPVRRVCNALTVTMLRKALIKLGKDPDRFTWWYDTSGLTLRPTRLEDALNLYKEDIISAEAVRRAGYFPEHDAPSAQESVQNFTRAVAERDPAQLANDAFRALTGITEKMMPKGSIMPAVTTPPPPPAQPETAMKTGQRALPGREPAGDRAGAPSPDGSRQLHASAEYQPEMLALIATADLLVRRALELAGGRLMRGQHGKWLDTPKHELHTKFRTGEDQIPALLAGAWVHVPDMTEIIGGVHSDRLEQVLAGYCSALIKTAQPHAPDILYNYLRGEGVV